MTTPSVKFLLVDDREANLLVLEGLLRREGLELLRANSGAEALELLLTHEVALALLDVQMPDMDGFELAELMRGTERTRRVPIIFITAGGVDHQRRFRGYEAGAVDFLFKPIESHILKSKADVFYELAHQREALKRIAEEAQAANRAKDDFLAALSHELRTPLTPVLLSAAALEADSTLREDVREELAMIRRNVELETQLIDDLLDVTRISRGKLNLRLEPCDLHHVIKLAEEIVRADGLRKQQVIVLKLEATRVHVCGDAARLQQVIWNLLKNAVKFTPEAGIITISTRNAESGEIVIAVSDSGIGIEERFLPHIFEAFDQGGIAGQHRFGGLGLGLAISRSIVQMHHGRIAVHSDGPGAGATFTVNLATCDAPQQQTPAETVAGSAGGQLKLLVVDDHEATRTAITRLLSRDGHEVVAAGSVQEALAASETQNFHVVITDLGLPDGSGLDLFRAIQLRQKCPGIALSGYGSDQDVQQTREAGFIAHLIKPVRIDQLRQVLADIPAAPVC